MKFLKIISAILFFSFSGNFHNQLFAQAPTKSLGKWTRELKVNEYLENGEFKARLVVNSDRLLQWEISQNGNVVRTSIFDCCKKMSCDFNAMMIKHPYVQVVYSSCMSSGTDLFKLNKTTDDSAYFWLTSDGIVELYGSSGILGLSSSDVYRQW